MTNTGIYMMLKAWGGAPCDFGILPDTQAEIATIADADGDMIVTLGGVSVGDHDLVQSALGTKDFTIDFWKVAMRPGKPLIFGKLGKIPLLGMPGNPVSTLICAILFLRPAIAAMLGTRCETMTLPAQLVRQLPANDTRQSYLRAKLKELRDHIVKNADNVVERFPNEARKMHYGDIEHRPIYGEASPDEARALIEEGVEVSPLPVLPEGSHNFSIRVGADQVRVPGSRGARRVELFDGQTLLAEYVVAWDKTPEEYRVVSATNRLYEAPLDVSKVPALPTYTGT